jgi:hypothetical protein
MYSYDRATGLVCAITRGAGSWFLTAEVCVSIRAARVGFVVNKMATGWVVFIFIHQSCGTWIVSSIKAAVSRSQKTHPTYKTNKEAVFLIGGGEFCYTLYTDGCTEISLTVFCDRVHQKFSLILCSIIRGSKKTEI